MQGQAHSSCTAEAQPALYEGRCAYWAAATSTCILQNDLDLFLPAALGRQGDFHKAVLVAVMAERLAALCTQDEMTHGNTCISLHWAEGGLAHLAVEALQLF